MTDWLEINGILLYAIRVIYLICVSEIWWRITLLFDYPTSIISCQRI